MITHSRVALDEDDLSSVTKVLRSGRLAQGKKVASLENRVASFIGVNHAVAVSSGTAALHLSLLSLEITRGDEVILPGFVCTALLNAVNYVRATPVLADIDPDTYNISPQEIEKYISDKTAAIIVPHMFGLPADMDGVLSLGIPVVEDCAQSVGARFKGKYTGSMGTISILSLYATKVLGAGEGGMILTNDPDLSEQARDLRDYDEKETYSVRYNYKLTDIQAALAESRVKKLPKSIRKRQRIAEIYNNGLNKIVSHLPVIPEGREHIYYRYLIQVHDQRDFIQRMKEKGIECRRPVFRPLHRYLELTGFTQTEHAWSRAVSIPIYPSLGEDEAHGIVEAIKSIMKAGVS
ncbi:MAG: DegT/DnrJ/EryC1/StrS family aminotransferase [Desulfobacterales bacterium]|nr:DegT/DnrJ/EryC1/StrS family aminotransferase [Desulfobacterales bacterium]